MWQDGSFESIFSTVYITASELEELDRHGWYEEVRQLMKEDLIIVAGNLTDKEKVQAEQVARGIADDPASGNPDWRSHLPESEAMVLMQQRTNLMIELLLLDERAARRVAQKMGLRVMGFPGILGRAGLDGIVTQSEIRQLLKACREQGTHYSDKLIETVAQTYGR